MRADLSPGLQAAQATHAALDFAVEHPEVTKRWHDESNYLVVLSVPDERTLLDYADRLTGWCGEFAKVDAPHVLVHEPDINEHTALAVFPGEHWKVFGSLPLAGKEQPVMV